MIELIDDYFSKGCGRCARFATQKCSTRKWAAGLHHLRQICRKAGLTETVKWGHPCYTHANRNIALLGAFQDDYRITFMDAALLKDPQGLLERPGPNSQHPNLIRFRDNADVAKLQVALHDYLREAMTYAEKGLKPKKTKAEFELPAELADALDADPELAEAFHALTPGRQRSYAINLSAAKTSATRLSRIQKFRPKILAGKGAIER